MRTLLAALTAVAVLGGPALAQQTGSPETTGTLEAGANSFTEGQARSRMEAQGFTNIQGLEKDERGISRGRAMWADRSVEVMLDYRGNIATR